MPKQPKQPESAVLTIEQIQEKLDTLNNGRQAFILEIQRQANLQIARYDGRIFAHQELLDSLKQEQPEQETAVE